MEVLVVDDWVKKSDGDQFKFLTNGIFETAQRLNDGAIFKTEEDVMFFNNVGVEFCEITGFALNNIDVWVISNEDNSDFTIPINSLSKLNDDKRPWEKF